MTTYVPLTRDQTIAYIAQHAKDYNLDPAALLAVANGEGLGHPPTPWYLPGEKGLASFGPPSWYAGGAGADFMKHFGISSAIVAAQAAWSTAGLDYWMKIAAADGGAGKTGAVAIDALVRGYERPARENVQPNIDKAITQYKSFQQAVAQALGHAGTSGGDGGVVSSPPDGNAIVPVPPDSGGTGSTGSTGTSSGSGSSGGSQDVKLGNIGPVDVGIPSGLVLGLFGMGLLALGALLLIAGSKGPMRFSDTPFRTSNMPDMASWNRGFDAGIRSVRVRGS
jgi:hypothetical protein